MMGYTKTRAAKMVKAGKRDTVKCGDRRPPTGSEEDRQVAYLIKKARKGFPLKGRPV